jgi:hypothetical protein
MIKNKSIRRREDIMTTKKLTAKQAKNRSWEK